MPTRGNKGTARRLIQFSDIPVQEHQTPTPPDTAIVSRLRWVAKPPIRFKDYELDFESSSMVLESKDDSMCSGGKPANGGALYNDDGRSRHLGASIEASNIIGVLLDFIQKYYVNI
jgi:hypothetical protein